MRADVERALELMTLGLTVRFGSMIAVAVGVLAILERLSS